MRLILTLLASNKWPCNAIDIKSAFLQGKQIERPVFLIHHTRISGTKYSMETQNLYLDGIA